MVVGYLSIKKTCYNKYECNLIEGVRYLKIMRKIILTCMTMLCLNIATPVMAVEFAQVNIPKIDATSAILVDTANGQILYEKQSEELLEVGSLTKLLTLYVVLSELGQEDLSFDTIVPISQKAYEVSQDYDVANVPLNKDTSYTVKELVEAVSMTLANGATIALSELVASDEASMLKKMTSQLKEWGIDNSVLYNVTGLNKDYSPTDSATIDKGPQNQMSAEAVAIVAYHLLNDFPEYTTMSKQLRKMFKKGTNDQFELVNYNLMLPKQMYEYDEVDGLMLGNSKKSGAHLAVTTNRNDMRLLSVVLGAKDDDIRYQDAKKILDYGYSAYRKEILASKGDTVTQIGQIPVRDGKERVAQIVFDENFDLIIPAMDTLPKLSYQFVPIETLFNSTGELVAPLTKGTVIGEVEVSLSQVELQYLPSANKARMRVELLESIEEAPWYTKAWRSITNVFSMIWEGLRKFFVQLFN